MGRTLKRAVILGDTVYRPGDEPSAEDAKLITNPAAWEDIDDADGEGRTILSDTNPPPNDTSAGRLPAPPRAGRGSGEDAWQAWANTRPELGLPRDARKEDIIAAAEQAELIDRK